MVDFAKLSAEFPREAIHWRAQTVTKDGTKAMALAYLDARDVMDRLDEVCGPANWQDEYAETAKGRLICRLSIRVNDEWIAKSDGAGESDIEGEKGAISGALKRAAVKWGVGRYLYDMPAPWVPCKSYDSGGKKRWSEWAADPWDFVHNRPAVKSDASKEESREVYAELERDIRGADTIDALKTVWTGIDWDRLPGSWFANLEAEKNARYRELTDAKSHLDRMREGEAA